MLEIGSEEGEEGEEEGKVPAGPKRKGLKTAKWGNEPM